MNTDSFGMWLNLTCPLLALGILVMILYDQARVIHQWYREDRKSHGKTNDQAQRLGDDNQKP